MTDDIRPEIEAYATMLKSYTVAGDFKYANNYELLLDLGRPFEPRRDSGLSRPKKLCFQNCFDLMQSGSTEHDWYYCEGVGRPPDCGGMLFDHAWLVDKDGWVIDPTWDWHGSEATSYYGIAFESEYTIQRALATKVYGVLGDADLLRFGIPVSALANFTIPLLS